MNSRMSIAPKEKTRNTTTMGALADHEAKNTSKAECKSTRAWCVLVITYCVVATTIQHAAISRISKNGSLVSLTRRVTVVDSAPQEKHVESAGLRQVRLRPSDSRFPRYGTKVFSEKCAWGMKKGAKHLSEVQDATETKGNENQCTFIARPFFRSNEGISPWSAQIFSMFLLSYVGQCRILIDYGPDSEVWRVFSPVDNLKYNWTLPDNLVCLRSKGCHISFQTPVRNVTLWKLTNNDEDQSVPPFNIPQYRSSYKLGMQTSEFQDLQKILPGFEPKTGMACAFHSLFQLAPSAAEFVPNLFTEILPALHDDDALVMGLYVRTGRTDQMAKQESKGETIGNDTTVFTSFTVQKVIKCALKLEEEYISRMESDPISVEFFSRIVWIVITDSPKAGQMAIASYNNKYVKEKSGVSATSDIKREVLTTSSRGVQTRPKRNPTTADFGEAAIDWYLLGETDLVIGSGGYTFGSTAALRSARPNYECHSCTEQILLRDERLSRLSLEVKS